MPRFSIEAHLGGQSGALGTVVVTGSDLGVGAGQVSVELDQRLLATKVQVVLHTLDGGCLVQRGLGLGQPGLGFSVIRSVGKHTVPGSDGVFPLRPAHRNSSFRRGPSGQQSAPGFQAQVLARVRLGGRLGGHPLRRARRPGVPRVDLRNLHPGRSVGTKPRQGQAPRVQGMP